MHSPAPPQPPAWNPSGERRSITLRSTTAYALDMLRCELAACMQAEQQRRASLQRRLSALASKAGTRLAPMQALVVQQALAVRASRQGAGALASLVRQLTCKAWGQRERERETSAC